VVEVIKKILPPIYIATKAVNFIRIRFVELFPIKIKIVKSCLHGAVSKKIDITHEFFTKELILK
jgi:hypothetical protein